MGLLTDTKLSSNLTTVPEAVRNYLELASGDRVEWHVEDGSVVVRKHAPAAEVAE
jgi:bifunctional DNA-binding transcriptional regulator/antitoxin component of YhaV-PrlF toxin-antitoxin module